MSYTPPENPLDFDFTEEGYIPAENPLDFEFAPAPTVPPPVTAGGMVLSGAKIK